MKFPKSGFDPVFDMDAVTAAEKGCRIRLEQEPGDTSARLNLAWCLALLALYEAGRETSVLQVMKNAEAVDKQTSHRIKAALLAAGSEYPGQKAGTFLRNCLHEAMLVMQLSYNAEERAGAQKLRTLMDLSGGGSAIQETDQEADRILATLTRELLLGLDDEIVGNYSP